jgi:hypothetical protein
MRVVVDDGGSGRDDSWLYCNLCHYLGWLMGCGCKSRSELERSDLVENFRGTVGAGYYPDLDDASAECDILQIHLGPNNEHCSRFDAEHGLDVAWATIFDAIAIDVGVVGLHSVTLAAHCSDCLVQHREKGHFADADGYPV